MSQGQRGDSLNPLIAPSGLRIGIGVHDGLSALIASRLEVRFLWLSSFSASAAHGRPDAGLLDASEMAGLVFTVSSATAVPAVVDMESGYGDTLKVAAASRQMAKAGAAAVCIEDNSLGKRSSLYDVGARALVSGEEHAERIAAARSAVGNRFVVIARTEALVAGLGVDEAVRRCERYVEAGADAVFVQATEDDGARGLLSFHAIWDRRTPLFIAPTCYPHIDAMTFAAAGASHVIFANHGLRAAYRAMTDTFRWLVDGGDLRVLEDRLASVRNVAEVLGQRGVVLR